MKKIALLVLVMAVAVAGLAMAQAKPNFSGKWVPKEGAAPAGGRGMGAGPMTVTQTATELKQEMVRGENTMTNVYKLDGTESINKTNRGEMKSTATFDGAKLVIKTAMDTPNGPMETTATWSLSADGKELTITRTTPRGESSTVYVKQ
jgi:hypothetical protein